MPAAERKCLREGRAQTSLRDSKENNALHGFSTVVSAEGMFQDSRSGRGTVTAEALALGKRVVVASTGSVAMYLQVLRMDLEYECTAGMRVVPVSRQVLPDHSSNAYFKASQRLGASHGFGLALPTTQQNCG